MDIRIVTENIEKQTLSAGATCSSNSRGRLHQDKTCSIRTCFQHDRDRILHSKAFRRLKYKTQVFLSPEGDHYRTRLTHTLEVAQIARTISRALRLNEDLTEAIALAHDLGHTPFGHAGERILNQLVPGGFHHVLQSLRVVDVLEKDGKGLNLTYEVRDGIRKHSKGMGGLLTPTADSCAQTLEGQVVRIADIIAYVCHDLDDAIRGHVIMGSDIPSAITAIIGERHSSRIDHMVCDLLTETMSHDCSRIAISQQMDATICALRDWLYDHVYRAPCVQSDFEKAAHLIESLYRHFIANEESFIECGGRRLPDDGLEISVADFIAGMTDRFALTLYRKLFLPDPWTSL
jgi:dGTPase